MSHAKRLVDDLVSRAREDLATDAELDLAEARLFERARAKPARWGSVLRFGAIGVAIGAVVLGVVVLDREAPERKTDRAKVAPDEPAAAPPIDAAEARPAEPMRVEPPAPPARAPIVAEVAPERSPPEAPAPEAPAPEAPAPEAPVPDEIALVEEAERALASDPARTLELAETHRRFHARGILVHEREILAIRALAALGRIDAARARAERFTASFPSSPHRARIEALVMQNP